MIVYENFIAIYIQCAKIKYIIANLKCLPKWKEKNIYIIINCSTDWENECNKKVDYGNGISS